MKRPFSIIAAAIVFGAPVPVLAHGNEPAGHSHTQAQATALPEGHYEGDGHDHDDDIQEAKVKGEATSPWLIGGATALLVGVGGLIYAVARK